MKYSLLPKLMWAVFKKDFKKQLPVFFSVDNASEITKNAHRKYKEILADVDEFDKNDRYVINILSCACLASFLLSLPQKPEVAAVKEYYRAAMTENSVMKLAMKKHGSYTKKGRERLKRQAKFSQTNNNPYSWKFEVRDGETLNQYSAIFYTCGICHLMKKLSLAEYIPALCSLDYDMAKMAGTEFHREYTLAAGGPYCDCNYNHQGKHKE